MCKCDPFQERKFSTGGGDLAGVNPAKFVLFPVSSACKVRAIQICSYAHKLKPLNFVISQVGYCGGRGSTNWRPGVCVRSWLSHS